MLPFFTDDCGNPSSPHGRGRRAADALNDARHTVARCIGADEREIVFTSGATESNNLAILGTAAARGDNNGGIVISAVEHHSVTAPAAYRRRQGQPLQRLPVDGAGVVDLAALDTALRQPTLLVSVMAANNETGVLHPVADITRAAHSSGAIVHTDATQAIGKIPVDVDDLGVDLLSLSGHKFGGPKGIGALYVRRGCRLEPIIHGGSQQRGRRAGTENVPLIAGLARAIAAAVGDREAKAARMIDLRDRLEEGLRRDIGGVTVHGAAAARLPNIASIGFDSIEAEPAVISLDRRGIACSAGSACTSGVMEASHVLAAMGVEPSLARGSLRFSLGPDTSAGDIDYTVAAVREVVAHLRRRRR